MRKIAKYTIYLNPWGVYEFPWGTAVKHEPTSKWTNVILSPYGQEINVEHLKVKLHNDGIEFY